MAGTYFNFFGLPSEVQLLIIGTLAQLSPSGTSESYLKIASRISKQMRRLVVGILFRKLRMPAPHSLLLSPTEICLEDQPTDPETLPTMHLSAVQSIHIAFEPAATLPHSAGSQSLESSLTAYFANLHQLMITIYLHSKPTNLTLTLDRTSFNDEVSEAKGSFDLSSRFTDLFRTLSAVCHEQLHLSVHYKTSAYVFPLTKLDGLEIDVLHITNLCVELNGLEKELFNALASLKPLVELEFCVQAFRFTSATLLSNFSALKSLTIRQYQRFLTHDSPFLFNHIVAILRTCSSTIEKFELDLPLDEHATNGLPLFDKLDFPCLSHLDIGNSFETFYPVELKAFLIALSTCPIRSLALNVGRLVPEIVDRIVQETVYQSNFAALFVDTISEERKKGSWVYLQELWIPVPDAATCFRTLHTQQQIIQLAKGGVHIIVQNAQKQWVELDYSLLQPFPT
ncbi:hypothetical protein BT69DRAFT_1355207 [Atractiella rhizophila]|nr:hypothetical protein BT69DRAFT_1355207 [Atractiella rhizophila]